MLEPADRPGLVPFGVREPRRGDRAGWLPSGNVKRNLAPFPGRLSIRIVPPCGCTMSFTVVRPNPVPSDLRPVPTSNRSNMRQLVRWAPNGRGGAHHPDDLVSIPGRHGRHPAGRRKSGDVVNQVEEDLLDPRSRRGPAAHSASHRRSTRSGRARSTVVAGPRYAALVPAGQLTRGAARPDPDHGVPHRATRRPCTRGGRGRRSRPRPPPGGFRRAPCQRERHPQLVPDVGDQLAARSPSLPPGAPRTGSCKLAAEADC